MMKITATFSSLGVLISAARAYADPGDFADARGDRIERRLDRAADRAQTNGHDAAAQRLDARGDRLDRRLDRRGEAADRLLDR
jgi:hypothetical protein